MDLSVVLCSTEAIFISDELQSIEVRSAAALRPSSTRTKSPAASYPLLHSDQVRCCSYIVPRRRRSFVVVATFVFICILVLFLDLDVITN
ncbi:hypothetical protein OROGR_025653 [Orobanche gracilis]